MRPPPPNNTANAAVAACLPDEQFGMSVVANTRSRSIGLALTDTLDDLISEERIHPQLAMKILSNFDQAITEALQKNVKSRLQFKVTRAFSIVSS